MKKINLNEKLIVDLYVNYKKSTKELASIFNVSNVTIRKRLKNHITIRSLGESNRKYDVNHTFFEKINTEEKAYWLGVLYADGNISKTRNTVILSMIDKEHIEKFKKSILAENKIYTETHKIYKKKIYKLTITSKKMVNDLINLGCVPKKSFTISFPKKSKLPDILIKHFIRGYFDGDGWISVYQNSKKSLWKTITSGFCSASKIFLCELQKHLHKQITIHKSKNTYIFKYSVKDSIILYNYMYTNSTIYLNRKQQKFEEYFKERSSSTTIGHPTN